MANLSVAELFDSAFFWYSHNTSFILPTLYDRVEDDASWILASTLIFFTMHTGLALIESGVISKKNQTNVMMRTIVDICVGGIGFWIFGFALMFGRGEYTNSLFGLGDFFINTKVTDPLSANVLSLYFFQMSFSTITQTIVSGAISERVKFSSYIMFAFLNTIVYAVGAGWIWGQHGWLKHLGVFDFAGSGPIHVIGGASAFIAAWYIGPRTGRFDKGREPPPLGDEMAICTGCFIIWWAWFGFNAGSSYGVTDGKWEYAARAGAGTSLASMSGGLTAILLSLRRHGGKVDVYEAVQGVLSALVAIGCGCSTFSMHSCFFIGMVASMLTFISAPLVDKLGVDDCTGATAIHFVGGAWGQLALGLFAESVKGPKGLFMGGGIFQLTVQLISVISLTIWAASATLAIIWFVDHILRIRMSIEEEKLGCDYTEHFSVEYHGKHLQIPTLDKIISITSPTKKFPEPKNLRDFNNINRRRTFSNSAFEMNEH